MTVLTRRTAIALLAATPFAAGCAAAAPSGRPHSFLLGINLAGAEFESIGGKWAWPHIANLQYYLSKGFTVFRIPFRWERLQPAMNGALDDAALAGLDQLIDTAIGAKSTLVLDVHDYGRHYGAPIGDPGNSATIQAFADFWGRLAARYSKHPGVWYGLMNEPHDQDPQRNLAAQNAACAAIRKNGGKGKVLFSGVAWTGAHSWISSGNATVMLGAVDPANNFAFDMHQYLDVGFGGSHAEAIPHVGASILFPAITWARANDKAIFIGEFATGPSTASLKELNDMLKTMVANRDVIVGGTYWAGGGVWSNDNMETTDPLPSNRTIDRPQTDVLLKYKTKFSSY